MQELKPNTLLRGGKYKIISALGQGGFGITYKAMMKTTVAGDLGKMNIDVPVAIKEFFIKERCVRDEATSHVSIPTEGGKDLVLQFRKKFIKEAHNIAGMNHPNIVKVTDVFEENNTVYYVMQYLAGGSLSAYVRSKGKGLSQDEALKFVQQVGAALEYMHEVHHTCHLDVKPGNILLDANNNAVLIDFGLSKNYDESGLQTSSTPVGISKGYAPLEQYQQSLKEFSPQTDIYSLGATLYFMLTGKTPPEASEINEDGLPPCPANVSPAIWAVIDKAMQPRRRDRYASVKDMINDLLGKKDKDETVVDVQVNKKTVSKKKEEEVHVAEVEKNDEPDDPADNSDGSKGKRNIIIGVAVAVVVLIICYATGIFSGSSNSDSADSVAVADSAKPATTATDTRVTDKKILDPNGNLSYTYTGTMSGAIPEGQGYAVYPNTDKDGRQSYAGNFHQGQRHGKGKLVYTSGDYFEGEFNMGHFKNGKYHIASDGSYFVGDFKNDSPWDGKWYNSKGTAMSSISNGSEK